MAQAGVVPADLDYSKAINLSFVGAGVGMDLKK